MRCRIPILIALAMFPSGPAAAQDSGPKQSDLAQQVQQLMDVQVGIAQMVPPGMSIEAKEISRSGKSADDLVVQYTISS